MGGSDALRVGTSGTPGIIGCSPIRAGRVGIYRANKAPALEVWGLERGVRAVESSRKLAGGGLESR